MKGNTKKVVKLTRVEDEKRNSKGYFKVFDFYKKDLINKTHQIMDNCFTNWND